MGYNFKCHKTTFYRLTIHPPVWKSKHISGQTVLSRPPWLVFLINFSLNRRGNANNCVTQAVTLNTYSVIRFQQTTDDYLLEHLGEKRKAQWTTFNFNVLKGIVLEISSNKNAN